MNPVVKRVLLVADYGANDLAFSEVKQRLFELAKDAGVTITVDIVSTSKPFDTEETARIVRHYADSGNYDCIYHNTAPRKDNKQARAKGDGEPLAATRYQNMGGKPVDIVGVFAADGSRVNTFSYLDASQCSDPRDASKPGIFRVDCATDTSQFRSRDVFPKPVIDVLAGKPALLEPLSVVTRPMPSNTHIPHECATSRHGEGDASWTMLATNDTMLPTHVGKLHRQYPNIHLDFLRLKAHGEQGQLIEAAFAAAQLACNARSDLPRTMLVPSSHILANGRAQWYIAELDNGSRIISDRLEVFSFAKERVRTFWQTEILELHQLTAKFGAAGMTDQTAGVRRVSPTIPKVAPQTVAYVDGYGNCKLAGTFNALKAALLPKNANPEYVHFINVTGNKEKTLTAAIKPVATAGSSFSVAEGQMAFSSGSSGWKHNDKATVDYHAELFLRGGSASKELSMLRAGDTVKMKHSLSIPAPASQQRSVAA